MRNTTLCIFLFVLVYVLLPSISMTACSAEHTSNTYWNGSGADSEFALNAQKTAHALHSDTAVSFDDPVAPQKKNDNERFRIGIVVSGDYREFFDNFKALVQGFSGIGWATDIHIPDSIQNTASLIEYLHINKEILSEYIEFPASYYVDLNWGDNEEALEKIYFDSLPDVDLILAYGGMAAKRFYQEDSYMIPVLADAITDPISAGVTLSVDDSGKDFFSCKIDSELFKQQVRVFYAAVGFEKLGIVYGDDEYGVIYGAVRDIEAVAEELGFEIVRNTAVKEEMADDTVDLYLYALQDVAERSDAVYIGASTAVTEYDIMLDIVRILDDAQKPSFALEGSIRVKDGILYSLSASTMTRSGIYMATKISHLFNGVLPRVAIQRFENVPSIAINVETARLIGYKIPIDILINSEEVYTDRKGTMHTSD